MASIVEREAKKKEEQPLMAGVFEKRYKINMPFESCATVQYLFEKPKKRLLEKDLLIESEYNNLAKKIFFTMIIINGVRIIIYFLWDFFLFK